MKIGQRKGRNCGYYMMSRDFDLPELKLLVDAVQSSKFITKEKSEKLIKKLEQQASKYDLPAHKRGRNRSVTWGFPSDLERVWWGAFFLSCLI